MYGAGKRVTKKPDWYTASPRYPIVLPPTDFDITYSMSDAEDLSINDSNMSQQIPEQSDMIKIMLQQFDQVNKQFEKQNNEFREIKQQNEQFQNEFEKLEDKLGKNIDEIRADLHHLSNQCVSLNDDVRQECKTFTENQIANSRRECKNELSQLSERVHCVEGQAARLSALENLVHNMQINNNESNIEPLIPKQTTMGQNAMSKPPNYVFGPALSSTTIPLKPQPSITRSNTESMPPVNPFPVNFSSVPQFPNLNQSSFTIHKKLEKVVPEFNGDMKILHPEDFLMHLDNYFQSQNLSDQNKLYDVRMRLVGEASLWFRTLTPVPSSYQNFVSQFRKYFWSDTQQTKIMNEIYKPYYHRDTSTLRKHAMEWIVKSQHLQPPIAESVLVKLITNHFPESIASSIRIQRIKTLNDLQETLSQLEYTPRTINNATNNNQNNSDQHVSHPNRNQDNSQNYNARYQGRNYNPQYRNNNSSNNNFSSNNITRNSHENNVPIPTLSNQGNGQGPIQ